MKTKACLSLFTLTLITLQVVVNLQLLDSL
jgi:hypothetical protein